MFSLWYDKINRNDSDKTGTSPSKKQLQDILYKANKGDKNALLKLIKGWNHKAGIGTNARTPEEIAAGNKRVVDNLIKGGKDFAGEILSIYDIQRLFTGKDPVTGKDANRGVAGFWLAVDVVTVLLPFTKLGKIGKGAKAADVVDDASDAAKGAKVADAVDTTSDTIKNAKGSGRAKNKIKPDITANGPHSVYKRDLNTGQITNYKTYELNPHNPSGFQEIKGYDGVGESHFNKILQDYVHTPHVHDNTAVGGVRVAEPWEIPKLPGGEW